MELLEKVDSLCIQLTEREKTLAAVQYQLEQTNKGLVRKDGELEELK